MADLGTGAIELLAHRREQSMTQDRVKIGLGFVIIFTIALDPDALDGRPAFELAHGSADAGFADTEFADDIIKTKGAGTEIEQGINLAEDPSQPKGLRGAATSFDELATNGRPIGRWSIFRHRSIKTERS